MGKKIANILILSGVGLAAYGLSGFSGDLGNNMFHGMILPEARDQISGSFEWSSTERGDITVGALLLTGGLLLRADSK